MKNKQHGMWCGAAVTLVAALVAVGGLSGCSMLDRAYKQQVTWTNAPVVQVVTNTLVVTRTVPVVTERTNIVFVTNAVTGEVAGYATREPVATNLVMMAVTNYVPVFMTNVVQVPVTNLVAKPEAEATIQAAGTVVNTFAPGIGSPHIPAASPADWPGAGPTSPGAWIQSACDRSGLHTDFLSRLMAKDLGYAKAEGREVLVEPEGVAPALDSFHKSIAAGHGNKYFSAVVEQF